MKPWIAAAAALAGAGLVHFGFSLPARREATALRAELGRAIEKRRDALERLERLERSTAESARVSAVLASVSRVGGDPVAELRRSVLETLREAGLTGVRLTVGSGRDPVGATVQVTGQGGLGEVSRFCGRLVEPAGIVLERVRFSPVATRLGFEISGVRLRGVR